MRAMLIAGLILAAGLAWGGSRTIEWDWPTNCVDGTAIPADMAVHLRGAVVGQRNADSPWVDLAVGLVHTNRLSFQTVGEWTLSTVCWFVQDPAGRSGRSNSYREWIEGIPSTNRNTRAVR